MEVRGCMGKFGTVRGVPAPIPSMGASAGVTGGKDADKDEVEGMEVVGGSMACCP